MCRKWYNPSKLTLKYLDWSRCDPFWQNHGKGSVNWDQIFVIRSTSIQNKMSNKIQSNRVQVECREQMAGGKSVSFSLWKTPDSV